MTDTIFKPTYTKPAKSLVERKRLADEARQNKESWTAFQLFEAKLERLAFGNEFKDSIIETCDTADFAKLKLEELGLPYTATDVLTLTGLIMQHQRSSKQH